MPSLETERVGIVGLGAIGGSLALALRERTSLRTWSRDPRDRELARSAGITVARDEAWVGEMSACTIVVLAVPLDEISGVVRALLPHVADACLVMHASSLQRREALGLSESEFERVVGAHPIAGSERSGFAAADRAIFCDATLRAEARAAAHDRTRIEMLWCAAGASRFVWDDASRHDALMAWISHLPQLTATALAAVLADQGVPPDDVGPGASDTTRLAGSNLAMWSSILERAPRETIDALRGLTSTLGALGDALEARRSGVLAHIWERGRVWRSPLEDQK